MKGLSTIIFFLLTTAIFAQDRATVIRRSMNESLNTIMSGVYKIRIENKSAFNTDTVIKTGKCWFQKNSAGGDSLRIKYVVKSGLEMFSVFDGKYRYIHNYDTTDEVIAYDIYKYPVSIYGEGSYFSELQYPYFFRFGKYPFNAGDQRHFNLMNDTVIRHEPCFTLFVAEPDLPEDENNFKRIFIRQSDYIPVMSVTETEKNGVTSYLKTEIYDVKLNNTEVNFTADTLNAKFYFRELQGK